MSVASEWMSTEELSEITGHARATIEGWRNTGRKNSGPPYYKFGRLVRFKRSEVEAWLEKCRHASHAEAA